MIHNKSSVTDIGQEQVEKQHLDNADKSNMQLIYFYRRYQCDRNAQREQIIRNTVNLASAYTEQQANKKQRTSNVFSLAFNMKAPSWSRFQVMQGMMAASFVLLISMLFISVEPLQDTDNAEYAQNENSTGYALKIPDGLYKHSNEVSSYIQPNITSTMGFSSLAVDFQAPFRIGTLVIDISLLAKTDNRNKIQQAILESMLALKQSNSTEVSASLKTLSLALEVENSSGKRVKLIQQYELRAQETFSQMNAQPLYNFGKWLEISLLSIQLAENNRPSGLKQLLQHGRVAANNIYSMLPDDFSGLHLIEDLKNSEAKWEVNEENIERLHKKLLKIKAIML